MTLARPIRIEARADATERPWLAAGAEMLSECLASAAPDYAWPVQLNIAPPDAEAPPAFTPSAIVLSLSPEVGRIDEPIAVTQGRWRDRLRRLAATGAPVFVCTVFRHVPDRGGAGAPSKRLERIRRLNLMAAELSRELGVLVVDLDRALAHIGGYELATDYRLGGVAGADVAGHTLAWSLLSLPFEHPEPAMLEERARARLGRLEEIDGVLARRRLRREAEVARG
jgi:hypothetical protein